MKESLSFQYCQKLVIVSSDYSSVLLAQRHGEADLEGVYTFVGGKMEVTDADFLAGMAREKNEEIGQEAAIDVIPNESFNTLFRKKDGSSMVLPHIAAIYRGGVINLNEEEYSEYRWVSTGCLTDFSPKVDTIEPAVKWALNRLVEMDRTELAALSREA